MPPKVKGLLFSFLTATLACGVSTTSAQQVASSPAASRNSINSVTQTITDRLLKVRAMIAARQTAPAIFELEKIKKEMSGDDAVQSVVRTMLVGVYLEQSNHERAKELLTETFERSKNRRDSWENGYPPVAGQVIKSAYSQLDRYKKLGFNLADASLPVEVSLDLGRWRNLLEMICEQMREMSLDERKTAEALMLLEEAAEARGALARDEYEAATWRNTVEDAREMIANAQTKVADVDNAATDLRNVAGTTNLPNPASSSSSFGTNNAVNTSATTLSPTPTSVATKQIVSQVSNQRITDLPKPVPSNNSSSVSTNNAVNTNNTVNNASVTKLSPMPAPVLTEPTTFQANNQQANNQQASNQLSNNSPPNNKAANAATQPLPLAVNSSIADSADQTSPEALAAAARNNQRSRVVISKVALPLEAPPASIVKTELKSGNNDNASKAAEKGNATEVAEKEDIAKASGANDVKKLANNDNLMQVGSLVQMATRRVNPIYPSTARDARIGGVIKAEVIVNEEGSVEEVKILEGPKFLRSAASYALYR